MYNLIYNNNEHNPTQRRGDMAFSQELSNTMCSITLQVTEITNSFISKMIGIYAGLSRFGW